MNFYRDNREKVPNAKLNLKALGIKDARIKEAFMAFCENPQEIMQDKPSTKVLNEAETVKSLRQVNDQVRLLNNAGAEEGPDGEFIDFFKEMWKQFNWAEGSKIDQ